MKISVVLCVVASNLVLCNVTPNLGGSAVLGAVGVGAGTGLGGITGAGTGLGGISGAGTGLGGISGAGAGAGASNLVASVRPSAVSLQGSSASQSTGMAVQGN